MLSPPAAELLTFLEGLGFEDLYRRRPTPRVTVSGNAEAALTLLLEIDTPTLEEFWASEAGELLGRILRAIQIEPHQARLLVLETSAQAESLASVLEGMQPTILVALGTRAAAAVNPDTKDFIRLRQHWHELGNHAVRFSFHPFAIVGDQSLRRPTWDDFQAVRDRLGAKAGSSSP
jgi:hypothetical protein